MTQEFNNHKSFTQLGHTAEFQQNLFADDCKKVGIITSIQSKYFTSITSFVFFVFFLTFNQIINAKNPNPGRQIIKQIEINTAKWLYASCLQFSWNWREDWSQVHKVEEAVAGLGAQEPVQIMGS